MVETAQRMEEYYETEIRGAYARLEQREAHWRVATQTAARQHQQALQGLYDTFSAMQEAAQADAEHAAVLEHVSSDALIHHVPSDDL